MKNKLTMLIIEFILLIVILLFGFIMLDTVLSRSIFGSLIAILFVFRLGVSSFKRG